MTDWVAKWIGKRIIGYFPKMIDIWNRPNSDLKKNGAANDKK
jgi:hypothetical protein